MSSSRSFGSGRPVASQSFGYIEIAVKPGSVFSSLTSTRSVPRSRKKSTRAMPETPPTRKTSTASRRTSRGDRLGDGRRDQQLRPVLDVLVVVVVELAPRHDLADDRRLRLVVAEHGALELPRVDPFLDEDPLVVAEGEHRRPPPRSSHAFTFVTPTEEPPQAGLTKSGSAEAERLEPRAQRGPSRRRRADRTASSARGVGMPASRRSALKTALSMPIADPVTPAPT